MNVGCNLDAVFGVNTQCLPMFPVVVRELMETNCHCFNQLELNFVL